MCWHDSFKCVTWFEFHVQPIADGSVIESQFLNPISLVSFQQNKIIDWDSRMKKWHSKCNVLYQKGQINNAASNLTHSNVWPDLFKLHIVGRGEQQCSRQAPMGRFKFKSRQQQVWHKPSPPPSTTLDTYTQKNWFSWTLFLWSLSIPMCTYIFTSLRANLRAHTYP